MKRYFIWWVARAYEPNGGQWYGPRYLTGTEAFQEQLSIQTNNANVTGLYRWVWSGEWQYDTRSSGELLQSDARFAWF